MRWIKGAGYFKEPDGVNEDVANALVPRFELFFALGGVIDSDTFNEMNETELHACSKARAVHDSRIANIIQDRQAALKDRMKLEEDAAGLAGKLINQGQGVSI